jgi:hypothetical protein
MKCDKFFLYLPAVPEAGAPGTGATSPACLHYYRVKPEVTVYLYRWVLVVDREDCKALQKVVIFLWKLIEFLDRRNIHG